MSLRLEAWTPPGSAVFEKKIETVEAVDASGSISFRGVGNGRMVVAEEFDDLRRLIDAVPGDPADDVATMIRVWDDELEVHIQDWLLEPQQNPLEDQGLMDLGGPDVKAILAWAYVEAQDWDGVSATYQTRDPDWIYGGRNLLRNISFEDHPLGISNQGFEDGTRDPWYPGAVEGISANAIVQQVEFDTGGWALRVQPLLPEGGASTTVRGLIGANFYTVTARVKGVAGTDYQIGASGPAGVVPVGMNSVLSDHTDGATPGGWEVQQTWGASGAWETRTLIFGTAGGQTSTQISIREAEATLDGGFFYVDVVTVDGFGIGVDPWKGTSLNAPEIPGGVSIFQASTDHASDGSWSAKVRSAHGEGIYVEVPNVIRGARYTAEADVGFIDTAGTVAILVTDVNGNVMGTGAASVPTGAFTRITAEFVVPDFVAGSRNMALFKILNESGAVRTFYVDNVAFYQGRVASTVGTILLDQRASLDLRNALDFVTYDFTTTLDSAGNAWDTVLSHTIRHGGTDQLQVVQAFERMGYEARLVVDDYDAGTYLLQVFNPAGMGTDLSGDDPAILVGQGVTAGDVTRRHAAFNAVQALGRNNITSRAISAASAGAIGRRERLFFDQALDAELLAAAKLQAGLNQGMTAGLTVVTGDDYAKPLVDYRPADIIDWNLADGNGWATQRLGAVSYQETQEAGLSYTLFPDVETFSGGGAIAEGVRQLLADRKLPHDHDVVLEAQAEPAGGNGGMASILICDEFADAGIRAKADYVIDSSTDAAAVIDSLLDANPLNIQTIWVHGYLVFDTALTLPAGVQIIGLAAASNSWLELNATLTVGAGGLLRDLSIDATTTGFAMVLGAAARAEHLQISGADCGEGVISLAAGARASDIWAQGGECGADYALIYLTSDSWQQVSRVTANNFGGGAVVRAEGANLATISDISTQACDKDLVLVGAEFITITGWASAGAGSGSAPPVVIDGSAQVTFSACEWDTMVPNTVAGFLIDGSSYVTLDISNQFSRFAPGGNDRALIVLLDSLGCVISPTVIGLSGGTTRTDIDFVRLVNADENMISYGMYQHFASLPSNEPRHAILIDSNSDANTVVGNVARPASRFTGNVIQDNGTNTVLLFPADATYGDNFT